ncbi:DUF4932 domain-containing protein [Mucilaginibacter sp. HME9299]|uniref:DUF4932 domain-containing protein n=1 Tax=Mucilaginibacter aquatilis TaxID=1517760 RepID=A0A6I4IAQ6_9SPHI|nr:DUF4932 domain-containing protein [Mucilaginibacter aquatilis]
MNKFSTFKNAKGVKQLNAQLSRNPALAKSYVEGLYAFQMKDGRFGLKADYRIDLNKIDFKRYGSLLESFYKETAFHSFYMQHEGMYSEMVAKANNAFTLAAAQKSVSAQGYQVVVSALAKGTNTMSIKGHAYTEGVIFAGMQAEAQSTPAQVLASRE